MAVSAVKGKVRRARPGGRARKAAAPVDPDRETRERLLSTARALFAANGYRRVTVRELCAEARANVAAINYHFGGKYGLYREVLDEAVAVMQATSQMAMDAARSGSPEQRLRAFIRVFLQRVGGGGDPWIRQLMAHEMAEPTDALDQVIRAGIVPRISYISQLVAEILGMNPDDERVMLCVLSVQSQFHTAAANPVAARLVPGFTADPEAIERLAQHIADFSIGGIRSLRKR